MKLLKLLIVITLLSSCNAGCNKNDSDSVPPTDDDTTIQQDVVIKVMSYNIHRGVPPKSKSGDVDLTKVADVIKAHDPDLVGLNEVDKFTRRSGVSLNMAKKLGELTGMYYYFAKAMDYDGGEYGDAVLSKFPIIDSTRYALPPNNVNGIEPRDIAMITVKVGDQKILFASTHLDHTGDEQYRILQANAIVNDILPNLKYPLIMAGDWNATPKSEPISILTETLTPGCYGDGCPLTFPYDFPSRTLDYVMYMPKHKFVFLDYQSVSGITASDHLPVVAKIRLNLD
ncbi:MAG TPA: endonuclease/exonuclease/phosphatase family protein [Chitinophagaceae bacterium]|nr:endonuclease/exonuclease/phosphatase family protein [Chitinophagaceae bacterium]